MLDILNVLKKRERKFRAQLRELVTTKFLDDDHCESIRQHYYNTSLYGWKKTGSNMFESSTGSSYTNPQQSEVQDSARPCAKQSRDIEAVADIEQPVDTESGHARAISNASQSGINHGQATNGQDSTAKDHNESEADNNSGQVPEVVTGLHNSDREQQSSTQVISRNNNSDMGLAAAVRDCDSGLVTEVNNKSIQKPKTNHKDGFASCFLK